MEYIKADDMAVVFAETRQPPADFILTYEFCHSVIDGRDAYHILVSKDEEGEKESAFAYDVSSSVTEARRIFDYIADGTVTPMTFYEVLDDIL